MIGFVKSMIIHKLYNMIIGIIKKIIIKSKFYCLSIEW